LGQPPPANGHLKALRPLRPSSDLWSGDHSDTLLSPMRVKVLGPGLPIEYPALMLDYPLPDLEYASRGKRFEMVITYVTDRRGGVQPTAGRWLVTFRLGSVSIQQLGSAQTHRAIV
jgi:hypothetical protein